MVCRKGVSLKFMQTSGRKNTILLMCQVVIRVLACIWCVCVDICAPAARFEVKLFISQGSRVLTSTLLITCREGKPENEMEEVAGRRKI